MQLGNTVAKNDEEQTALTSVVKDNRLAINDLTEKLRRQRLIDEGQYGILYRRLTAVAESLRQVNTSEEERKKALLRAQATLHQVCLCVRACICLSVRMYGYMYIYIYTHTYAD
jgi:hypothetical protein